MRNESITLITRSAEQYDDDGFITGATEKRIDCYAQIKTTTYSEFYSSDKVEERATDIFVVGERDYKESMQTIEGKKLRPNYIEYDGIRFKIIRRYRRATSADYVIELSCTEVEANG